MVDKSKIFDRSESNYSEASLFDLKETSIDFSEKEPTTIYYWGEDINKIKEYYKLVNKVYQEEIHIPDSYSSISREDLSSKYFLGEVDGKVVSGARMTIANNIDLKGLPSEKGHISYTQLFKEFNLEDKGRCEITKFATEPAYRNNRNNYTNAFSAISLVMEELDIDYMIICSEAARLKLYNFTARKHFDYIAAKDFDVSQMEGYPDIESKAILYKRKETK